MVTCNNLFMFFILVMVGLITVFFLLAFIEIQGSWRGDFTVPHLKQELFNHTPKKRGSQICVLASKATFCQLWHSVLQEIQDGQYSNCSNMKGEENKTFKAILSE